MNENMKINKEVSNLARKLEYLNFDSKERRKEIEFCFNPLIEIIGNKDYIFNKINDIYNFVKKVNEKQYNKSNIIYN